MCAISSFSVLGKEFILININQKKPCTSHSHYLAWNGLLFAGFCATNKSPIEQLWNTQTKLCASFSIKFKAFLPIAVYIEVVVICNQRKSFDSLFILFRFIEVVIFFFWRRAGLNIVIFFYLFHWFSHFVHLFCTLWTKI